MPNLVEILPLDERGVFAELNKGFLGVFMVFILYSLQGLLVIPRSLKNGISTFLYLFS